MGTKVKDSNLRDCPQKPKHSSSFAQQQLILQGKGEKMRAVILAGGKGMRLKPYTVTMPKPLVPVGEEPILKILLQNLRRQGVREATVCVNHMADLIEAYFGDGSKLGISVKYSHELQPLGTAAPIKLIKNLPDDFLVMNGDLLTDLSFQQLFQEHKNNDAIMTIATHTQEIKVDYGVIKTGPDHTAQASWKNPPTTWTCVWAYMP